jgi:hypothetical protein
VRVSRFLLAAFVGSGLCCASLPASAQGVLPASFAGWTQNGAESYSPLAAPVLNAASDEAAHQADTAAKEYGFRSGQRATYLRGPDTLDATLYRMNDPSGAYGEYSYLRTPGLAPADFTEHSSISPDRALILIGNLVLDVRGNKLQSRAADLRALVAAVQPHAEGGPLPDLWQRLPAENVVRGTDRYILGPQTLDQLFPGGIGSYLGFSKGAEAELAHYRLAGHDATLLIADFPTPQLAEQTLAGLQKNFNVNGSKAARNSAPLFAKRALTLLVVVSGASSESEANGLLDRVHPGTVLTWNEPTFQFKEPTIEAMVVGAIVGTGAICVFALIAGVAFGGVRLVVKRFFPGRIFDRGSHLQVLQLGLAAKPINSDDFYATGATAISDVSVDKNLPDRIALRIFR